jgi:hypothetical protein
MAWQHQTVPDLGTRLPALLGGFHQRPHDDGGQRGRHLRAHPLDRWRRLGEMLGGHGGPAGAAEWRGTGEQFVRHDTQAVQVAPGVHQLTTRLLRAHIRGRAHREPLSGDARPVIRSDGPGNPEVGQHCPATALLEQDVFRFHIPVHQPRLPCRLQGIGQVEDDALNISWIQRSLALQPLPQALPGDIVHDIVEQACRLTCRMHRHDVRMPEPRDHPGLGQKPLGNGRVSGKLGMDDLDRDRPVQRQVGGQEDHPHAARPQLALEPVLAAEGGLEAGQEGAGNRGHAWVPG